jgi:hypothetical protein
MSAVTIQSQYRSGAPRHWTTYYRDTLVVCSLISKVAFEVVGALTARLIAHGHLSVSDEAAPHVTTRQIVCGDCDQAAGLNRLPYKTFLTAEGRCADCGGLSYELAATVSVALTQTARKEQGRSGGLVIAPPQEPDVDFIYAN